MKGELDGFTSGGVFTADDCLATTRRMEGLVSTTAGLDEPCLGFLLHRRLGRLPVSRVLDNVFLFSKAAG